MNKNAELFTTVELLNDHLNFSGSTGEHDPISIDYTPPLGDNLGYTSLELLLLSLSSCLGSVLLIFLRKNGKQIDGLSIKARGIRKQDHPTSFSNIVLEVHLLAKDVSEEELKYLCSMAEKQYCPVWDMIRGNVTVETVFDIQK